MSNSSWKAALGAALSVGLIASPVSALPALAEEPVIPAAAAEGNGVIINEAYTNAGSSNAVFTNKFVELYNPTDEPVSLESWSIQYRSAGGTDAPHQVIPLDGSIAPDSHYLVQGNANGGENAEGAPLPAADVVNNALNVSGTQGTIILARTDSALDPLATGSIVEDMRIADLLGYGSTNTFETTAAPSPSNNSDPKSINRTDFVDTDDNSADFILKAEVTPTNAAGETGVPPEEEPPVEPEPAGEKSIAEIQGSGAASPLNGKTVTTQGKVTAVYPTGGFNGYYIQTPGTGGAIDLGSHSTSHGVFVFSPATVDEVQIGDFVEVNGLVKEYFDLTEIDVSAGGLTQLDAAAEEVKAATVGLPAGDAQRESLEGMLLAPQGDFTITDNYSLNHYGEIGLAAGTSPLIQPTAVAPVGSEEIAEVEASNAARSVTLDDGASTNFFSQQNQPLPYLTMEEPARVGSPVHFETNVVFDYRFGVWKFQPLTELNPVNAETVQPVSFENTRTAAPEPVGGDITLASFNVLNYFSTTGDELTGCEYYTDRDGNPIAVRGGCEDRGAANEENLQRQQDKIVDAINSLDADVVSLAEIENSAVFGKDRDDALRNLVAALNSTAGDVWEYVESPADTPINEDVIRTAFIYKKPAVETVGESQILLGSEAFSNAREPLAQAFKTAGGPAESAFVAIANHFKSKGSDPGDGGPNADKGDGAGAWNATRTAQAEALVDFANKVKAEIGTELVFLMGDFNSYKMEDPIEVLRDAGYVNQGAKTGEHTYAYGGAVGSLDYIFASGAADATVTGADIWNINSVESVALEYSRYNYNITDYYAPDAYRSSDHDPILVGLDLAGTGPEAGTTEVNILGINDFHGRIDENTVNFAGTVAELKASAPEGQTAFISAGDNIGASLFASSEQDDVPTIEVLNALGLKASTVGNHEFDKGWEDLRDRVSELADFPYLGANVYAAGTQDPVLDEYQIIDLNGVQVAVIGAVTQETPSLVSPNGISMLEFGDPVEAVNRVAQEIEAAGLADVIIAAYHEGASAGTLAESTLEEEVAAGGAFASIVNETSPLVDAMFTGHTHKQYAWDAPVPGEPGETRPIVQTGSYGAFIGQIELTIDTATGEVTAYEARNAPQTETPAEELIATYPAVAEVDTIVDAALEQAEIIGSRPVASVTADITTAFSGPEGERTRDDRGSESALGHLVADALLETLSPDQLGAAEIGVTNPGGLRAELCDSEAGVPSPEGDLCDGNSDGVITFMEANNVLPFVNNLWTTTLTGAQVKTMLEQQWQPDDASRPFLALGLSENVAYTYDPTRAQGDRILSVTVNGEPLDPERGYRIGTFSFLAQGGDNFTVFTEGTDTKDSGLVDREAWIAYLEASSPVSPDFSRRGVVVQNAPESVQAGQEVSFEVSKLDLASLGAPDLKELVIEHVPASGEPSTVGTYPVVDGAATVTFTATAEMAEGYFTASTPVSGTMVRLPLTVSAADAADCREPGKPDQEEPGKPLPICKPVHPGKPGSSVGPWPGHGQPDQPGKPGKGGHAGQPWSGTGIGQLINQ
ncbi:ExeM/NucH family extracellular endonuclease [Arthrobacter sp. H14]|uniref:ExeM/NucH family extracellular endonuclease n=1 Tax=Arthrobacter sp. H14 TaxID=1312959 RepID=UPI0004BA6AF8|nr:ExeM/NucH family extracellular endonuclease [Arthrobacter sp. H14]